MHSAVIWGIMPFLSVLCALYATVAHAATTTVTIGVGDTTLTITGRASPDSFITILDGNNVVGTTTANSSGAFTKTLTAVAPGIHQLQVYGRDSDGRLTDTIRVQVDANEHFETTIDLFLPPSLQVSHATVVQGQTVNYSGATIPNGTVSFVIDDTQTVSIAADSTGRWQYQLATNDLAYGSHTVFVFVTDSFGTESYRSQKVIIRVIDQPTDAPSTPPAGPGGGTGGSAPSEPPTIDQPPTSTVTDNETTIEGTAPPNSQVTLYNGGRPIGSTFADQYGRWRITFTLNAFEYNLQVQACQGETCGEKSDIIRLFYQPPNGQQQFYATTDQFASIIGVGEKLEIPIRVIRGEQPFAIEVRWGDGRSQQLSRQARQFSVTHAYERIGQYSGTIVVTDADNKTSTIMFSVLVVGASEPFSFKWLIVLIPFLLLLSASIGRYALWRIKHRRHTR
jgi:hypothetical protein